MSLGSSSRLCRCDYIVSIRRFYMKLRLVYELNHQTPNWRLCSNATLTSFVYKLRSSHLKLFSTILILGTSAIVRLAF